MNVDSEENVNKWQDSSEINLLSMEKMDRSSPDLWPHTIPSLTQLVPNELASDSTSVGKNQAHSNSINSSKWMSELNKEDVEFLHELASRSTDQLMKRVKELIDLAYQLGLEESNQMTRGRLLNILDDKQNS